jgi:hypothetical protein
MGTSQFGRGHNPCTGTESQSTEWQKGSLPDRTQRTGNTTAVLECRSGNEGEHMSRERPRGLMWAGGPGPRRHPRAETFTAAGYGARAASQAEEVCERK